MSSQQRPRGHGSRKRRRVSDAGSANVSPSSGDPALVTRREQAEERARALFDRIDRAGLSARFAPATAHYAAQAMGMIVDRLVRAGFLSEDEMRAELLENEVKLLTPAFERALQEREEWRLTDGGSVKRHDDPQAFTSPALLRRERVR